MPKARGNKSGTLISAQGESVEVTLSNPGGKSKIVRTANFGNRQLVDVGIGEGGYSSYSLTVYGFKNSSANWAIHPRSPSPAGLGNARPLTVAATRSQAIKIAKVLLDKAIGLNNSGSPVYRQADYEDVRNAIRLIKEG